MRTSDIKDDFPIYCEFQSLSSDNDNEDGLATNSSTDSIENSCGDTDTCADLVSSDCEAIPYSPITDSDDSVNDTIASYDSCQLHELIPVTTLPEPVPTLPTNVSTSFKMVGDNIDLNVRS
jgi:hypothetical protein